MEKDFVNKLTDTKAKQLEGLLTYTDTCISDTSTLMKMKNYKSPGLSGFSADLLKSFGNNWEYSFRG